MKKDFLNLLGFEGTIIELSNELQKLGCEDICEFGNWSDLLEDGNVVIATDEIGEEHIHLYFELVFTAGYEEEILATVVKITNIQSF